MYAVLREEGFFKHILSQSDDWSDLHCKVNGLCQLDEKSKVRRIDILGVPWYVSLLSLSGSSSCLTFLLLSLLIGMICQLR